MFGVRVLFCAWVTWGASFVRSQPGRGKLPLPLNQSKKEGDRFGGRPGSGHVAEGVSKVEAGNWFAEAGVGP